MELVGLMAQTIHIVAELVSHTIQSFRLGCLAMIILLLVLSYILRTVMGSGQLYTAVASSVDTGQTLTLYQPMTHRCVMTFVNSP